MPAPEFVIGHLSLVIFKKFSRCRDLGQCHVTTSDSRVLRYSLASKRPFTYARTAFMKRYTKQLRRLLPSSVLLEPQSIPFFLLASSVTLVLISIAASQILLAAALVGALTLRGGWAQVFPRLSRSGWALLFFFLWTVMAALASADILLGLGIVKKFFIFLLIFLVPFLMRGEGRRLWIYHAIFVTAAISSIAGLGQFIIDPDRDLLHRISGFMSHVMTYSGLQMLVLVLLAAYISCFRWKLWWIAPLGMILSASLILSYTRSAWLGTVAGVIVVLLLRRSFQALGVLVVLLGVLYLFAPAGTKNRLRSGWDVEDVTTRGRIELVGTSLRLIRDNPWFGVGPKNVSTEALRYRGTSEFPDWQYQHMHNNFLQIAAERGIPGLIFWLWFMVQLAWDAFRNWRSYSMVSSGWVAKTGEREALLASTAALGAWAALLVSGMFEYNFGDSEFLTMFLFLMSAPYASSQTKSNHGDTEYTEKPT